MKLYQNPFRARASEHQRDLRTFLRHFGVGVLELLPTTLWDRPLIIRSAPGGGKTSIMRLFTVASLGLIHDRRQDFAPLFERLGDLGAVDAIGPKRLGVLLNLSTDYRPIVDVGLPEEITSRLFLRLLNARIAAGVVRAALEATHLRFPEDAPRVELLLRRERDDSEDALTRLGGQTGSGILTAARAAEREILTLLDSLAPLDDDAVAGHVSLYAIRALSDADVTVDGTRLSMAPLIMFDDGHELAESQRLLLLDQLAERTPSIGRWYSERFEALSSQEVVTGATHGRDHVVLELESAARAMAVAGRGRQRFDRILVDLGNLRAARTLERYAEGEHSFSELIEVDSDSLLLGRGEEILTTLKERVLAAAGTDRRYEKWIEEALTQERYQAASRWRELEVLIARDAARPTRELFDMPLTTEDAERMSGSNVREAAELFLAKEFKLPYYAGPDAVAKLGSHNIEQFLSVCGHLFEEVLGGLVLGRRPNLSASRQDAILRQASEDLWRDIPRRLPHGRDVQQFLAAIVSLCRRETFRATAPYAPGVTGTAISMRDRERLLDPGFRQKLPGADRLFNGLASAIAFNVVSAELDRPVKGNRWMVIYLNRLLCPRFDLPLGRGGFRERRVDEMTRWMIEEPPIELGTESEGADVALPL